MKNPNLVGEAWIHSKQANNDSNPKFIEDEFELTRGQKTDAQFIAAAANNAKANGETIVLAGHSGGGLRNYLTLQNAKEGQFAIDSSKPASAIITDQNGNLKPNSVLAVQFSGTPANYQDLLFASSKAGAGEIRFQNHSGDTVGNVLGMNGNIVEGVWSGANTISLFEPPLKPNLNYQQEKIVYDSGLWPKDKEKPSPFNKLTSDHSKYTCILSSCNQ